MFYAVCKHLNCKWLWLGKAPIKNYSRCASDATILNLQRQIVEFYNVTMSAFTSFWALWTQKHICKLNIPYVIAFTLFNWNPCRWLGLMQLIGWTESNLYFFLFIIINCVWKKLNVLVTFLKWEVTCPNWSCLSLFFPTFKGGVLFSFFLFLFLFALS